MLLEAAVFRSEGVAVMKSKLKRSAFYSSKAALVVGMVCGIPQTGMADNVYTFDAPQFTLQQTTPLLNPQFGQPRLRHIV
jgi:hypothetical protein